MKTYIQSQLANAVTQSGKDGVVVYRHAGQHTLEPYCQPTAALVDPYGATIGQMWVWTSRQKAWNDLYKLHTEEGLGYDQENSQSDGWFDTLMGHIHRVDAIEIE